LIAQIVTGLFLAIHYCPNIDTTFSRVSITNFNIKLVIHNDK